jgi:hypothetical protein
MDNPERFNCFRQIAAHVGGMTLALVHHHPLNWTFHWRGICRAISSKLLLTRRYGRARAAGGVS